MSLLVNKTQHATENKDSIIIYMICMSRSKAHDQEVILRIQKDQACW